MPARPDLTHATCFSSGILPAGYPLPDYRFQAGKFFRYSMRSRIFTRFESSHRTGDLWVYAVGAWGKFCARLHCLERQTAAHGQITERNASIALDEINNRRDRFPGVRSPSPRAARVLHRRASPVVQALKRGRTVHRAIPCGVSMPISPRSCRRG